jgi:hypothetical protein
MKVPFGNAKPSITEPAPLPRTQAGRNSRFATIVEKIDLILRTSEQVEELLSKTIFELQQPKQYYGRLRESILVGLESVGVELSSDVENAIADFVPKNVRAEPSELAGK